MTTSQSTATADVETSKVETAPPPVVTSEPVLQQVVFSDTSNAATTPPPPVTTQASIATTKGVERSWFGLPSKTTGSGTLSATATSTSPLLNTSGRASQLDENLKKLKAKDESFLVLNSEVEDLGATTSGKIQGPRGVVPSMMSYEKPEKGKVVEEPKGLSLGSRQRLVFEKARQRAQVDIEADRDSLAPPFASADPFSRPKVQDVQRFSYEPSSPDISTAEEIEHIRSDLVRAGVPESTLTFSMWDIARYCADAGSSASTEFIGTSSYSGRVTRMEIASVIKKHTTLRRYCGFYAKIVWNIMLSTNIPPSGWVKKGYKKNTRFSAFDFFEQVSNNAALEPENGLVREPNHEELVASQVNKGISLHRTEAAQDKNVSTAHGVTGGRAGPRSRLLLKGKEMD
uniref:Capsid protein n=1 Tax=Asian prunus virus 2 TaxID=351426 RepID=A0A2L0WS61_9VIRU|nr:coat protein [Asian prunus virus 2]